MTQTTETQNTAQKTETAPGVRVPLVAEDQATGKTAEIYALIKEVTGLPFVPDMFRLVGTRPELLQAVSAGFMGVFGGGPLPRQTKELISAWSSKVNGCTYCVGTHNWFLQQFGGSKELADAIQSSGEPAQLPVDEKTLRLLELVTKVGRAAYKITDADWERAAEAGWSDEELLDAVFNAALFAFITRLVDATGLGSSVQSSRVSRQS